MVFSQKRYVMSELLSVFINGVFLYALIWEVQRITGSSVEVGKINALFSFTASLSVLIGPFIDRAKSSRVYLSARTIQLVSFFILSFLVKRHFLGLAFFFLLFIISLCDEFYMPALNKLLKAQLDEKALTQVNSISASLQQVTNVVALFLSGILAESLGLWLMVYFLMALLVLSTFIQLPNVQSSPPDPMTEEEQTHSYLKSLVDGWRYVIGITFFQRYILASFLYSFATPMLLVYIPFMASKHHSSLLYSFSYFSFFVGYILGSLVTTQLKPTKLTIAIFWLLSSLPLLAFLIISTEWLICLVIVCFGFLSSVHNILSTTYIQANTSHQHYGRVQVTLRTIASIGGPIASILAGWLLTYGSTSQFIVTIVSLIAIGGLVILSDCLEDVMTWFKA